MSHFNQTKATYSFPLTLFCSTSLPLARTRWVRVLVLSINLSNIDSLPENVQYLVSEPIGDLFVLFEIDFSEIFVRKIISRRCHRVEQKLPALGGRVPQHQQPDHILRNFTFRQRTIPSGRQILSFVVLACH